MFLLCNGFWISSWIIIAVLAHEGLHLSCAGQLHWPFVQVMCRTVDLAILMALRGAEHMPALILHMSITHLVCRMKLQKAASIALLHRVASLVQPQYLPQYTFPNKNSHFPQHQIFYPLFPNVDDGQRIRKNWRPSCKQLYWFPRYIDFQDMQVWPRQFSFDLNACKVMTIWSNKCICTKKWSNNEFARGMDFGCFFLIRTLERFQSWMVLFDLLMDQSLGIQFLCSCFECSNLEQINSFGLQQSFLWCFQSMMDRYLFCYLFGSKLRLTSGSVTP